MSFQFVKRESAHRTDDYWFEIDEYRNGEDQILLVHLQFINWSPSVLKRLLKDWRAFRQYIRCPLFAYTKDPDATWLKFVTRTGWRFHMDIACEDGVTRPLFIHTI